MSEFQLSFPSLKETTEFAKISSIVYAVQSVDDPVLHTAGTTRLQCHVFNENAQDMELIIVTSSEMKYICVAYRGTESHTDAMTDANMFLVPFAPVESDSKPFPFDATEYCSHIEGDVKDPTSTAKFIKPTNENEPKSSENTAAAFEKSTTTPSSGTIVDSRPPQAIKIHCGFNRAFTRSNQHELVSDMLDTLRTRYPNYKVVFTGHSLGAALSTLAAIYTAKRCPDCNVLCINFGSPRVGNHTFKEWVEQSIPNLAIWRVVHEDDIVPRWPAQFMGYRHVGHLIEIDRKVGGGAFYRHAGDVAKKYLGALAARWDVFPDSSGQDAVDDHGTAAYVNYLEQHAPRGPDFFPDRFFTEDDADHLLEKYNESAVIHVTSTITTNTTATMSITAITSLASLYRAFSDGAFGCKNEIPSDEEIKARIRDIFSAERVTPVVINRKSNSWTSPGGTMGWRWWLLTGILVSMMTMLLWRYSGVAVPDINQMGHQAPLQPMITSKDQTTNMPLINLQLKESLPLPAAKQKRMKDPFHIADLPFLQ